MACIAALGGFSTTCATGTLALGIAGVTLAAPAALAATYTPADIAGVTLQTGDVIQLSDGAGIGTAESAETLTFAADNEGVILEVTSGDCVWHVASSSFEGNAGVSTVNVASGATLDVYANTAKFPAFNNKNDASLSINLAANATLRSIGQVFGWCKAGEPLAAGARTLTMGSGSTWEITLSASQNNEWLNNTTVVMNHSTIRLTDGKSLLFERNSNAIKTTDQAVGMSLITGGGANGKLKVGGGSPELAPINGHEGCLFEIQRSGAFLIDDTNTADLRIESALQNGRDPSTGEGRGDLLKSGDGVLELTHASVGYTEAVYVTAGTLKLSGANGQAGSGTITVDSGATLELAHSQAATTTNSITLSDGATLRTGALETIGADASLLGTVVLGGTLGNNATITLGATTHFDISALQADASGIWTLISGGNLSGVDSLSTDNIIGWTGGNEKVFSLVNGKLLLAATAITSTDLYWDSTDTTWTSDTTYSNGTDSGIAAGDYDTIIFNNGTTSLTLGSDIANAVRITDNATLQLSMGSHSLTGNVTIDTGATLQLADNMAFTNNLFSKPLWNGTGTIILTSGATNHDGCISLANFNGTVQVSGNFNLRLSEIGSNGRWHLINGESWSGGNATIANNVIVDNFVLRPDAKYTFTGVVAGTDVTIGTSSNTSTVAFSNSGSSIGNVNVIKGTVDYNGTAEGEETLFTGNTHLAAGANMVLTPSGTSNADSAAEARQYKGAVYMSGTANSVSTLTFTDGSTNITGGLHLGETSESGKAGKVVVGWDKNHFINGLYGNGTLDITRNNHGGSNGNDRYLVLTGSGGFTGTLNITNAMSAGEEASVNLNFGMMVLGESNAETALQGAVVNFAADAARQNALVFTTSDSVISKDLFTGTSFQTGYAADAALAGLSGGNGTVFAKVLTLSGSGVHSYSGGLSIEKLVVAMQGVGKQALSGSYGNVEVQSGTLALAGGSTLTQLAVTGGTADITGAVTLDSLSTSDSGNIHVDLGLETTPSITLGADPAQALAITLSGGAAGTYTIFSGDHLPDASLVNITHADRNMQVAYANGVVTLTEGGASGSLSLNWNPASNDGVWSNDTSLDWTNADGGASSNFNNGDSVTFGATSSAQNITISGIVNPESMSFTDDSADYSFTLTDGSILELGTPKDYPSTAEQQIFTKGGSSNVSITGGTVKLIQDAIFTIAGGSIEVNSDIDIAGNGKTLTKTGAGTLILGGHLIGSAAATGDHGLRLVVNEGDVLFVSDAPNNTNNILDTLLRGSNRMTVADGSLVGIGGRGSADTYMFFATDSLAYAEGAVTSKLYLSKTGSGSTTIEYCPPNGSSTDTTFHKLVGSGTGDDGNLVFLRYAGSNQAPWNITLNDERKEGEQLFHGKLTIATNAWAGTGSDANMLLTVTDEDVLSQAVVELISQSRADRGFGDFALGAAAVQVAGLASVDGLQNIGDPHVPNGTAILDGGSSSAKTRLVLGNGTTASTLSITTAEGADYAFGGKVAAGISLAKAGAGRQAFSGDMTAFNGNVRLDAGTLAFTNGLSIDGNRTLAVTHGAVLEAALNLTGGTLSVTTVADAEAASLAGNALTLGGGTALALSGIESASIGQDTQINLLSHVGSVQGAGGSAISFADGGIDYSPYFSSIAGLDDRTLAVAKLNLIDGNLCLTFADLALPDWVWDNSNGSMTWSDGNDDNWNNSSGGASTPAGQEVWFRGDGQGTVNISGTVTPSNVNVTSGAYTFTGGIIDLGGTGALALSGSNAQVTLGSAGAVANGSVALQNGTLVLGADNALASTASLSFQGGLLSYAASVNSWTDFSTRITAAENTPVRVEVQGADNAVTWGAYTTKRSANSGVHAALTNGIEKTGEGALTVAWGQSNASGDDTSVTNAPISGNIVVSGGKLILKGGDYGGPTFHFTNEIHVAQNAWFTFDSHSTTANNRFNFSNAISGAGTVELGKCTFVTGSNFYGKLVIGGDNREFHGTWILWGDGGVSHGANVDFSSTNAAGASDATLKLQGSCIYISGSEAKTFTQTINVASGNNHFSATSGSGKGNYTFEGMLTGVEGASFSPAANGNRHSFTGNISGFKGTLENSGSSSTIVLGGEGITSAGGAGNPSVINAQYLYGAGTFEIKYTQDTILNSAVATNGTGASSTNLTHSGTGRLTLASDQSQATASTVLTLNDNTVQIGYVDGEGVVHNGNWAGTVAQAASTTGTLELVAGRLNSSSALASYTGNVVVNVGSVAAADGSGSSFDYGANSVSRLTSVSVNGDHGGQLTNIGSFSVGGDSACTTLNATFGASNIGTTSTMGDGAKSLISQTAGSTLTLQGGEGVTINMTIDAVIETLKTHKQDNAVSYLYLTDGTLGLAGGTSSVAFGSQANILQQLGIRFVGVQDGALVLSGVAEGMYIASADDAASQSVSGYNTMQLFKAVAVEGNTTFNLQLDGAPSEGMNTEINNLMGGSGSRFVVTNSSQQETAVVTLNNIVEQGIGSPDGYETWAPDGTAGADTFFAGSISTEGGAVQFVKDGEGTLTVGGGFEGDALKLAQGGMALQGHSAIGTLTDEGTEEKTLTIEGQLTLAGSGEDAGSVLDNATTIGGSGELNLQGSLSLSGGSKIAGAAVALGRDALLELDGAGENAFAALSGEGAINGTNSSVSIRNGKDATFSGRLLGTGNMSLETGAGTQAFAGVQGAGWNVGNSGALVLRNGEEGAANSFDSLTLKAGSVTEMLVSSTDASQELFELTGNLVIEKDAVLSIATFDGENFDGSSYTLGSASGLEAEEGYKLQFGTGFMRYNAGTLKEEDGKVVLVLDKVEKNLFGAVADSHNAHAGATLLWDADVTAPGDLKDISNAVESAIDSGNRAEANRLMAAAAGASIATLGSAFSGDVERQLRAIRNRTTAMGVNQCQVNENMPYFNAWVNAEGDYRKMDEDGTAAGYTLSSWGGTLGFDVDVTPNVTAGLAVTAMYGDLDTHGPDVAKGDLDTYYVSLFARYASRAWTHTFIATAGVADASLDRTVSYGSGSYRAKGDTEGFGFGLMYEAGYVIPLNEDATACFQPVFNVAWRHAGIDSYTESGTNAALHAGDQTVDVVTFGLGARFQSAVAENIYNRTALFEARALLKVDAGDRKSDLDAALLGGPASGNIESAELGAVGVELGAGLTIPVGMDSGALFIDGSAELRSGYANLNGTVGYRVNF